MSLGLRVLGGALEGVGKGWSMVEQENILAKRNAYLHEQTLERQAEMAKLQNENAAKQSQRDLNSDLIKKGSDQKFSATMAREGAAAKAEQEKADREWQERKMRIEAALEKDRRLAEIIASGQVDGSQVQDIRPNQAGNPVIYFRNGTSRTVKNVVEPVKSSTSDVPDYLRRDRPAAEGSAAKPNYVWDSKTGTFKTAGEM